MSYTIITAELPETDYYDNQERNSELRSQLNNLGLSFISITKIESGKKTHCLLVRGDCPEISGTKIVHKPENGKLFPMLKNDAVKLKSYLTFNENGKDFFYGEEQKEQNAN